MVANSITELQLQVGLPTLVSELLAALWGCVAHCRGPIAWHAVDVLLAHFTYCWFPWNHEGAFVHVANVKRG